MVAPEQIVRFELTSPVWKTGALTVVLYLLKFWRQMIFTVHRSFTIFTNLTTRNEFTPSAGRTPAYLDTRPEAEIKEGRLIPSIFGIAKKVGRTPLAVVTVTLIQHIRAVLPCCESRI